MRKISFRKGTDMSGSSFGTRFCLTTFGESHGEALGCVVDGCPAGLELSVPDIQPYLERRRPGKNAASTTRQEADIPELLSGVFEGKTTGAPIAMLIRNTSQRSADYDALREVYRPGHADFTFQEKYGIRDHRGGGRSSGRETAARVMGGAVAAKLLREFGISIEAWTGAIGDIRIDRERMELPLRLTLPTGMPDQAADEQAMALIRKCREKGDSVGGVAECRISGVPAGLGDPVFEKLDAKLAQAVFSIGAVKALEIGSGIAASKMRGSEFNDAFVLSEEGTVQKMTNHAGGILGGISDGSDILLHVFFKPTPSISAPQQTVKGASENIELSIHGRHDPLIGARAAVVVEAMSALVLADALLVNMTSRVDSVIRFYKT